ncbi:hypothetical protein ACIA5D_50940 [Actinoplanes sp. NPDC051513]|uniref:hypothetical protein n=1 Tax=Actinoplanes sp. NPDC051513 TaxID=3363908 RepID=UPI0037BD23E7
MDAVVVEHERLIGVDYSRRTIDQFAAVGATFEDCHFDRTRIKDAAFGAGAEISRYVRCSFDGVGLTALGGFTRFEGCTFRNLRVTKVSPDYLEFVDCVFRGRITGLRLWGAPLDGELRYSLWARLGRPEPRGLRDLMLRARNEIYGNDFTETTRLDVEFRFGVDLTTQRLPTGDDYLYLPEAEKALLHALAETASSAPEATGFLQDLLDREVHRGQRQLFLRPDTFRTAGAQAALEALRQSTKPQ